jgi:hypothetical protein
MLGLIAANSKASQLNHVLVASQFTRWPATSSAFAFLPCPVVVPPRWQAPLFLTSRLHLICATMLSRPEQRFNKTGRRPMTSPAKTIITVTLWFGLEPIYPTRFRETPAPVTVRNHQPIETQKRCL